jgi:hypothetical protein
MVATAVTLESHLEIRRTRVALVARVVASARLSVRLAAPAVMVAPVVPVGLPTPLVVLAVLAALVVLAVMAVTPLRCRRPEQLG